MVWNKNSATAEMGYVKYGVKPQGTWSSFWDTKFHSQIMEECQLKKVNWCWNKHSHNRKYVLTWGWYRAMDTTNCTQYRPEGHQLINLKADITVNVNYNKCEWKHSKVVSVVLWSNHIHFVTIFTSLCFSLLFYWTQLQCFFLASDSKHCFATYEHWTLLLSSQLHWTQLPPLADWLFRLEATVLCM